MTSMTFLRQLGGYSVAMCTFSAVVGGFFKSPNHPISITKAAEWEANNREYRSIQHMDPITLGYWPNYASFSGGDSEEE